MIGILGDGQLGRMLAMAAAQLGYRCTIFAPGAGGVAGDVAAGRLAADYGDRDALAALARSCQIVTYEFENVPVSQLDALGAVPLHPPAMALDIAQDRLAEKRFAEVQGLTPAPYRAVNSMEELAAAADALGLPLLLKTRRMGYDGKGQVRINSSADFESAWAGIGGQPAVAEAFIAHAGEFSVLLVRSRSGEIRFWDSPENIHVDGILARSHVPAPAHMASAMAAARIQSARIADVLNYVGVLACEFFVSTAAEGTPIFNEMAPRVHNSGHWTIEGAVTSQFENHIRAICGLPLGQTALRGKRVDMINLIGEQAAMWADYLADPAAHLHLYGKGKAYEGRKMGHVTRIDGGGGADDAA